jgi:hypothetical protein
MTIHKTKDGMNDPLFQELADPFYTIDLEIIKWFSRI